MEEKTSVLFYKNIFLGENRFCMNKTKGLAPERVLLEVKTVFRQGTKYLNTINEDFCSNDNPPRELFSTRPVYFLIVAKTVLMS